MLIRTRNAAAILTAALVMAAFLILPSFAQAQAPAKLLITQVEVSGSEYVVIRNPGSAAVDLSNYYVTDATFASGNQFYYNLPDPSLSTGGGAFYDFIARFPAGASIAAGQEASIAINGSTGFLAAYGVQPTFELYEDAAAPDNVPDMRPARTGSIAGTPAQLPTLTNTGEAVILFYWDGQSDLVTDIDYLVWGDKAAAAPAAVDKSGISIDGPDAGSTPTAYQADTPIAQQDFLPPNPTGTFIRTNMSEGTQKTSGGNGVGGRDETSENLTSTFTSSTKGTPPGSTPSDTTPPTLASASGSAGASAVTVNFSEAVAAGASTASNYTVYVTSSPSTTIAVSSASANGSTVTLTLASALAAGTGYTVKVSNVQDAAGNPIAANSTVAFSTSGGSGGGFQVAGMFQFGPKQVAVAFSDKVNASQATTASNYTLTPQGGAAAVTVQSVTLQENGQTAILNTASNLPLSATYGVAVSGVTSQGGTALGSGGPSTVTTSSTPVTGIADIQANTATYNGQTVTVIGQVYYPQPSTGTVTSYIQDGTGHGINVFGGSIVPELSSRGSVVKVTGPVSLFNTTTEISGFTSSAVASGQPFLAPKVLTVAQSQSTNWEGTYIQVTSNLTADPTASGSSNYNYPADPIIFRVNNATGINSANFHSGDQVTGAGAGSLFQTTYEILVGNASDFVKGTGGGNDTTPPTLASASGSAGASAVTVNFSEAVATGASTASNYSVYVTSSPSTTIGVTSASANGSTVTLTLASALAAGTGYTVKVSNVQDAAGNPIAANSTVAFSTSGGSGGGFQVAGMFQFGPKQVAVAFSDKVNASQATTASNYTLTPQGGAAAVTVQSVTLQENGQTAILNTASNLPLSATYGVAVSGVTSQGGTALGSGGPSTVTTSSTPVTGIADIQANTATYNGQTVTVIGQVYYPQPSTGTVTSYIQDGTGHGINVFGGSIVPELSSRGSVVKVTGPVSLFNTTTEISGFTSSAVASGQPFLAPKVLTVAQSQSTNWEGTYIQVTSNLTADPTASGSSNYNYPADPIIFRVNNATGINSANFHSGDQVTGAGAGSLFQTTYEILVGNASDFVKGTGGGNDTTPPTLASASGSAGASAVTVNFSEAVATGASTASNYSVYVTSSPSTTIGVTSASANGSTVTLTLASALAAGTGYTVKVSNVQDAAGNPIAANSTVAFSTSGGGGGNLSVVTAFQFGKDYVAVAFSAPVNPSQAVQTSNYSFTPALTTSSAYLQDNEQTVVLKSASPLPKGTSYSVSVSGVGGAAGETLSGGSATFQTSSATITDIADVHAAGPVAGQPVTVIGQVYIPTSSGTPNIYIQDGSGRGLNVFGGSANSAYGNRGAVVQVAGQDTLYFTTLEIVNPTSVSVLATNAPRLAPKVLSVAQAASSQWEGTYIQTTSTLTAEPVASGASNYNYAAGGITFRVRNNIGINAADYHTGDTVTGAGAGGAFQTTYQINVGNADDFSKGGGANDTTPPRIGSVSGEAGSNRVSVVFTEPVGTGANVASNYSVYPAGSPGQTISVNSATVSSATVTLTLAAELSEGTDYTVEVSNVQDLAGNAIVAGSSKSFTTSAAKPGSAKISVPAQTLVKNMKGSGEVMSIICQGEANAKAVCRIFDSQGRLVRVLFDGVLPDNGNTQATVTWDGRDQSFELVRSGMYICHLETTTLSGHVTTDQAPIVVSARLD